MPSQRRGQRATTEQHGLNNLLMCLPPKLRNFIIAIALELNVCKAHDWLTAIGRQSRCHMRHVLVLGSLSGISHKIAFSGPLYDAS